MGRPFLKELSQVGSTYEWAMKFDVASLAKAVSKLYGTTLLATGSGGSLTAAHVAAQLQEKCSQGIGKAITPMELLELAAPLDKTSVILLSAGGRNIDILRSFRETIKREPHRVLVLCGDEKSPLFKLTTDSDFVDAFPISIPSGRDGFLATNSLLAFSVLLCRAWCEAAGVKTNLPNSFSSLDFNLEAPEGVYDEVWQRSTISLLHGPSSRVAAFDLESKFTEAALGSLQISDYRNFAHGRHHWLAKHGDSTGVLAFVTNSDELIAGKTLDLIPADIPSALIRIEQDHELGTITSLLHSFRLTWSIGRARGIDPGRPGVPLFGRKIYHLRTNPVEPRRFDGLSERTAIAIERKSRRSVADLNRAGTLGTWLDAHQRYSASFHQVVFEAAIFDYDGTLCNSLNRFTGIDNRIASKISDLLKSEIPVGIATGRGRSVAIDLRGKIPARYHKDILIGYYNGGKIRALDEELPCQKGREELIGKFVQFLEATNELSAMFFWEPRELQVSIQPRTGYTSVQVLNVVRQIVEVQGLRNLSVLCSSHSIDVIAPGVSKLNLLSHVRETRGITGSLLCIGDRGMYPGNDYQLLSSEHSLSVDECSFDLRSCWNLGSPGVRGVQCTMEYMDALEIKRRSFLFNQRKLRKYERPVS